MSVRYVAVNWNRRKRRYDALLGSGVVGSVVFFAAGTAVAHPTATIETMLIRGIGFTGFLLLTLILAIGPLARLDTRFLPLLYNRRHLGVTLALLAVAHAGLVLFQYHALGDVSPLVSVLTANRDGTSLTDFPFEWLGIAALLVLLLLAATSHDYWLSVLTPPVWKRLHMLVYPAYLAVVLHVALGFLQDEKHPLYPALLLLAVAAVGVLHVVAGWRERRSDQPPDPAEWIAVCHAAEIADGRARIAMVAGERVAVFRHHDRLSCVSNVCKHQNGPLGEGRIIDGCITCPWHGYQYRPADGRSPPPFDDAIPTFDLRIEAGRVFVRNRPNPPGTFVEPVPVAERPPAPAPDAGFFVGYLDEMPRGVRRLIRPVTAAILVLSTVTMVGLALAQRTFQPAAFGFGTSTTVVGTVRLDPYPFVAVDSGAGTDRVTRYLLAGPGKHGARELVRAVRDRRARLTGQLAYRDNLRLLEVANVAAADGETDGPPTPVDLGTFRLAGEIADSKCYTGVMNPGIGTTHRGCAARCLSGGLTPLFVTADSALGRIELMVVGRAMEPLHDLAPLAGRRLTLSGRVWRLDDLWLLQLDRS